MLPPCRAPSAPSSPPPPSPGGGQAPTARPCCHAAGAAGEAHTHAQMRGEEEKKRGRWNQRHTDPGTDQQVILWKEHPQPNPETLGSADQQLGFNTSVNTIHSNDVSTLACVSYCVSRRSCTECALATRVTQTPFH